MALQYVGLNEINGSLVVLDHVKGASYDEMVEIQLKMGQHVLDVLYKLKVKKSLSKYLKEQMIYH